VDITADASNRGIRERAATIVGSHGPVPLALWTPEGTAPQGLVLIGHGAGAHKREDYVVALARRLCRTAGIAAAAIDAPNHGERRAEEQPPPALVMMQFAQAWSSDDTLTDRAVDDWTSTLDALVELDEFSGLPVGYWGLSMGTLFGLPFVAAEERIRTCVLGLAGLTGPTSARLAQDAPAITVPTLFLVQLDDELFKTPTSIELFAALGTEEKRLYLAPGRHRAVPKDAFLLSVDFLAGNLADVRAAGELVG